MQNILLTAYVLVWPLIAGIVMLTIARAFFKEWAQARREGRSII